MTPYYTDDHVTIYHGRCTEILPTLEDHVGLLLTDPPYVFSKLLDEQLETRVLEVQREAQFYGYVLGWAVEWLQQVRIRTAVDGWTPAWIYADDLYTPVYWRALSVVQWPLTTWYRTATSENIIQAGSAQPLRQAQALGRTNIYGPKTADLIDALIAASPKPTPESGVLLDPFMGTGSSLVAGLRAGWRVVGIETDEASC